ncbi:MAG: transcriptional regulator, partial [Croceimicrobium sp.]
MKKEWRKSEKQYYLPKAKPQIVEIPAFNFFVIDGEGNPNSEAFAEAIGVLYSLSYAIRMSPKKDRAPEGY